jgi:8-oxo-dGTP pyrophosphatase MutT (NUDIX family)
MLIGACALIVRPTDGLVLCLSRKDNPLKFSMPGGHVEEGETVKQGLTREIEEELGWISCFPKTGPMMTELYVGKDIAGYITHCYRVGNGQAHLLTISTEESIRYKWLSWSQLCDPEYSEFWKYNRKVKEKYERPF